MVNSNVKNSDIKIFVSQQIDMPYVGVSNFLYVSLVCGSFYAKYMNPHLMRAVKIAGI